MLILQIYLLLTYIGGFFIAMMTLNHDRFLTAGDIILFVLSPFTITPILFIQLFSQIVDIEKPIFRI